MCNQSAKSDCMSASYTATCMIAAKLNCIRYMNTEMGSWLFIICICVIKTDAVAAAAAELLAQPCGSALPWQPSSPRPAAPRQYGSYLFTQYLLLLHSSTGVNHGHFPSRQAAIVKLLYWKYQSAIGEGWPRRISPERRAHTAPQRSRTATAAGSTRKTRAEFWVDGIQMQRGINSELN